MTIIIFVLKGDLNGKIVAVRFFFFVGYMFKSTSTRVYIDLDAKKPDFSIFEDRFLVMGSMTFCLNLFRLMDISSKRHFAEYDILSKFPRKVSKFDLKCFFLV